MRKNQVHLRRISPSIRAYLRTHPLESPSTTGSTYSSSDIDIDTLSLLDSPSTFSHSSSDWSRGSMPRFQRSHSEPGRMRLDSSHIGFAMHVLAGPLSHRPISISSRPGNHRIEIRRSRNHRSEEEVPVEPTSTGRRTSGQGTRRCHPQPSSSRDPSVTRPGSQRGDAPPPTRHRDPSSMMTGAGPGANSQQRTVRFEETSSSRHGSPRSSRPIRTQSPAPERESPPHGKRFTPGHGYEHQSPSTRTYRRFEESDSPRRPQDRSRYRQTVSRSPQRQSNVRLEERRPRSSSEPVRPEVVEIGKYRMTNTAEYFANGKQFQPKR